MKKVMFLLLTLLLGCSLAAANQNEESAKSEKTSIPMVSPNPFFAAKGKYPIGTTFFSWHAADKAETNYIGQIWYPAEYDANAKKASYLPASLYKTGLAKNIPLLASLQSVTTGAMIDAPLLIQNNRYPILIYSPGLGLAGQAGTFFFEYLASRGFIVAAINHPGSSFFTETTDGSIVFYQDTGYSTPSGKAALTKTNAGQLSAALNALIRLNNTPQSMFFEKMDTAKVGVFGHSIGGRSALRAASLDKRFKAAADLDGSIEEEPPYTFSNQQILIANTDVEEVIQSEIAAGSTKPAEVTQIKKEYTRSIANLFNSSHAKKYLIYYKNTGHMNYTDLPVLLEHPQDVGTANGTIVLLSLSKMLEGFFSEAFFHPESSLVDKISQYPYAELKQIKNNLSGK